MFNELPCLKPLAQGITRVETRVLRGVIWALFSLKELSKTRVLLRSSAFLVGYILSPASWWNDLFVNVPLALIFAKMITIFLGEQYFSSMFSVGYAITNIVGVLLMKIGITGIKKENLARDLLLSILYSIVAYFVLETIL